MPNRIYIDCYAMVGPKGQKDVETLIETEVLLEEMEWCGIHGALIAHSTAKDYDASFGNRKLLRELKKSPRLYGAWTVMPHHTGEMASSPRCCPRDAGPWDSCRKNVPAESSLLFQ